MDQSNLGLISEILGRAPEGIRPFLGSALPILVMIGVMWTLLKPAGEALNALWRGISAMAGAIARLIKKPPPIAAIELPPEPIPSELTIWEAKPPAAPIMPRLVNQGGIPIVTFANMKGGVGKTTLVANLATIFRDHYKKPVLLIDFDYQGSLSQTIRAENGSEGKELRAHSLLTGRLDPVQVQAHARPLSGGLNSVELYPSDYPFATIENNLMIDWVAGNSTDIRYRLCEILRHKAFQDRYGIVLIDVPPRITTGTINALCASTHLVIPTKLDEMSTEAAGYFLQQLDRMRETANLFPHLQTAALVATMVTESVRLSDHEQRAIDRLNAISANRRQPNLLLKDIRIPQKIDIAKWAGAGVAALHKAAIHTIFSQLGKELTERFK